MKGGWTQSPANRSLNLGGFPAGWGGKESACNAGELDSIPGLGRSPGGGHGNPLQCSCLKNPHGQRNLEGYRPWSHKESDTAKRLSIHTHTHTHTQTFFFFFNVAVHTSPRQVQEIILSDLMYTFKHAQHQSLYRRQGKSKCGKELFWRRCNLIGNFKYMWSVYPLVTKILGNG